MQDYEDFFKALESAIKTAGSVSRLAQQTGISLPTLTRWRKRERDPQLMAVIPLLPYLDWPTSEKRPVMKRIGINAPVETVEGEDLPSIPVLLQAGAGVPTDFWMSEPERRIEILPQYYQKQLRAVEVTGDSMEPTIKQGAIVGVVPVSGALAEGKIYLVHRPPFGLVVKRVRADRTGNIILHSDNPQYEPQPVPYEGYDDIIVGQVVWVWQFI